MDDYVHSLPTVTEAKDTNASQRMPPTGGFNLIKFLSDCPDVLKRILCEDLDKSKDFTRVLGQK